jgi:ssRNA-specific RNase YbeY (16S rRNA maturation enzyme)
MPDPIPFVHIFGYGHQKEDSCKKMKNLIKKHIGSS